MKRAKIMLTSLAVLAVVGGALAFKAKTFNSETPVFCKNTVSGTCTFTNFQTALIPGDATSTTPCGVGITYYVTDNCPVTGGITPTTSKTVYATNPE